MLILIKNCIIKHWCYVCILYSYIIDTTYRQVYIYIYIVSLVLFRRRFTHSLFEKNLYHSQDDDRRNMIRIHSLCLSREAFSTTIHTLVSCLPATFIRYLWCFSEKDLSLFGTNFFLIKTLKYVKCIFRYIRQ